MILQCSISERCFPYKYYIYMYSFSLFIFSSLQRPSLYSNSKNKKTQKHRIAYSWLYMRLGLSANILKLLCQQRQKSAINSANHDLIQIDFV